MFDNYKLNLSSYIPRNKSAVLMDRPQPKTPMEEYNAFGELVGYSWSAQDSVVLEFVTDGNVVYEDSDFTTPGLGHTVDAVEYLQGKKVKLQIVNMRYEVVHKEEQDAALINQFIIESGKLVGGTYRCSLELVDTESTLSLVKFEDCVLFVK